MKILLVVLLLLPVLLLAVSHVGGMLIDRRNQPTGMFIPVAGGNLHVRDIGPRDGDGPALVLIHGASSSLRDMEMALGATLAERHRVILIDRPGHGFSDRPGGRADASPLAQARYIMEVLDALGVERFVPVGHSWAGSVAARLALDWSERVAAVVFIAPATHPWPGGVTWHYEWATAPMLGHLFTRLLVLPLGYFMIEGAVESAFRPDSAPQNYARRVAAMRAVIPWRFRANAEDVADLKGHVAQQALRYGEITMPALVVTGTQDDVVAPHIHAEGLQRDLPNARLMVIEGAGHMPHHAHAWQVIAEIEALVSPDRR